ncbi:Sorting nexin mvp1 [Dispira parvispora]|uniref:Sorting nexin MVP1 n=1 Tax=Dispira parvispora TaxID=1520584 RepID=A0A9W8AUB9_9FUNG|nr:Sorting nexin mvp1 [Dispira parvispora]
MASTFPSDTPQNATGHRRDSDVTLSSGSDLGFRGNLPDIAESSIGLNTAWDWVDPWSPTLTTSPSLPSQWDRVTLADLDLPAVYDLAFSATLPRGGEARLDYVIQVLGLSGLPHSRIADIVRMVRTLRQTGVNPGKSRSSYPIHDGPETVDRPGFDVMLAFVALAQKHVPITLEAFMTHRNDLPEPVLPDVENLTIASPSTTPGYTAMPNVVDPWDTTSNSGTDLVEGVRKNAWATDGPDAIQHSTPLNTSEFSGALIGTPEPVNPTQFEYLESNPEVSHSSPYRYTTEQMSGFAHLEEEPAEIALDDDRKGTFFKFSTYTVRRTTATGKVQRRYSDFVWLREFLETRYPWCMLPKLPPKAIRNSNPGFLMQRCRGLQRFMGFVLRHPRLGKDKVLHDFLTCEQSLTQYRDSELFTQHSTLVTNDVTSPPLAGLEEIGMKLAKVRHIVQAEYHQVGHQYRSLSQLVTLQHHLAEQLELLGTGCNPEALPLCVQTNCGDCFRQREKSQRMQSQLQRVREDWGIHNQSVVESILEYLRRYQDVLVALRQLLERRDTLGLNSQRQRILNSLESSRQRLAEEREPSKATGPGRQQDIWEARVEKDTLALRSIEAQINTVDSQVWEEYRLYHHSRQFLPWIYTKYARLQVNHHSLLLHAWRHALREVNHL